MRKTAPKMKSSSLVIPTKTQSSVYMRRLRFFAYLLSFFLVYAKNIIFTYGNKFYSFKEYCCHVAKTEMMISQILKIFFKYKKQPRGINPGALS